MSNIARTPFNIQYETFVDTVASEYVPSLTIRRLQAKREFGIKKYGSISYQLSEDNAMKVDTVTHAQEELEDCMNYLLNEIFKSSRKGNLAKLDRLRSYFQQVSNLYTLLEKEKK